MDSDWLVYLYGLNYSALWPITKGGFFLCMTVWPRKLGSYVDNWIIPLGNQALTPLVVLVIISRRGCASMRGIPGKSERIIPGILKEVTAKVGGGAAWSQTHPSKSPDTFLQRAICVSSIILYANPSYFATLKHWCWNTGSWYSTWIKLTFTITNWTQPTQTIITHQKVGKFVHFKTNLRNRRTFLTGTSRFLSISKTSYRRHAKVLTPCDNRAWKESVTGEGHGILPLMVQKSQGQPPFGCLGCFLKPWKIMGCSLPTSTGWFLKRQQCLAKTEPRSKPWWSWWVFLYRLSFTFTAYGSVAPALTPDKHAAILVANASTTLRNCPYIQG